MRGVFDELGAANASSDDEAQCAAGVPVRVEQTVGKMHNKLMVLNAGGADPRVVTGSLNWTAAGNARNNENIVILRDAEAAQTYTAAFAQWWDGSPATPGCEGSALQRSVYLPLVVGGQAQSTPVPTSIPTAIATVVPATPTPAAPCACTGNLYNCSDFPTQAAAQGCFD